MDNIPFVETNEEIFKLIEERYGRSKQVLQTDVETLRSWMETQKHLPEILDETRILNFFLSTKCSIEKSKRNIDMYYTLRDRLPAFYEGSNPGCERKKRVQDIVVTVLVPKPSPEMYRVWVSKILDKGRLDELDVYMAFNQLINLQEIRLKEDLLFGDVIIIDFDGWTLQSIMRFTPAFVEGALAIYEKVSSNPLKAMYWINSPSYISYVAAIFKKTMKRKLFDRTHICQDTSILLDKLPAECVPKDYGGTAPSVKELWKNTKLKCKQYEDRLDLLANLRVNESLRPEELRNDEFLGYHGNFKQFSID